MHLVELGILQKDQRKPRPRTEVDPESGTGA